MTSERKLRANRENAKRSTGPKTAAGKARSARNAYRHGLSARVLCDPELVAAANGLARGIAANQPNDELVQSSRAVAEAERDIARARQFRLNVLQGVFPIKPQATVPAEQTLIQAEQVETSARRDGFPDLQPADPVPAYDAITRQLEAADRYEHRALSRRKFAIRAVDEARLQCVRETGNSLLGLKF